MFTFGQFALPVAALIAIGLLFVGIKLFFLTPGDRPGVDFSDGNKTELTQEEEDGEFIDYPERDPAVTDEPQIHTSSADDGGIPLAGPLGSGGSSVTGQQQVTRNPVSGVGTEQSAPGTATQAPSSSKWAVQIGAFSKQDGATTLLDEVRKQGYTANISKIDSSGNTYHRVRIAAGDTKESAEKISAELQKKGYPVIIVPPAR
jgi:cell division protein FtsN